LHSHRRRLRGAGLREFQPFEQAPGAGVAPVHRGHALADGVLRKQVFDHGLRGFGGQALAPAAMGHFVGHPGAAVCQHRGLHKADRIGVATMHHDRPVEPVFEPIRRAPRFELAIALAQRLQ